MNNPRLSIIHSEQEQPARLHHPPQLPVPLALNSRADHDVAGMRRTRHTRRLGLNTVATADTRVNNHH